MKINTLFSISLTMLLFFTGCASDTPNNEPIKPQEPDTKGLTAFVEEDNNSKTRTTGDYDGSGINFYWTEGDRLWVNNVTLIQDKKNTISKDLVNHPTIPTAVKRAATAMFYFEGSFTGSSYPVRYNGKGSTVGDKVTFKPMQKQLVANDASHIGDCGDCGVATAIKSAGSGKYNFTLEHKASYLTLLPYSTIYFATTVKITQIKITTDEALSGQFDFDDNGIDLGSRPTPTPANRSITLTLAGGGTNGFTLPVTITPKTNAAVMVLPPGTYHNVKIEYTIYDQNTGVGTTLKKEYAMLTFHPGQNKKVSTDLKQMKVFVTPVGGYNGQGPNTNETMWYMHRGNPHMDITMVYAARRYNGYPANICLGGIWIKKKAYIAGFRGDVAPDGTNYITSGGWGSPDYSDVNNYEITIPFGNPQDDSYLFLPSVYADGGTALKSGNGSIRYWMSTSFQRGGFKGQVFASDRAPHNLGIGNNYSDVVMAYWPWPR